MARTLILVLSLMVTPLYAAELGDSYVKLFKMQLQLANGGNAGAQYSMGEMYEQGLGTTENMEVAYQWYEKAAAKGDVRAKHKLARRSDSVTKIDRAQQALANSASKKQTQDAKKAAHEEKMKKALLAKKIARAKALLKQQQGRAGAYDEEDL